MAALNPTLVKEQTHTVKHWSDLVVRKLKSVAGKFVHGKSGMVIRYKGQRYEHPEDKLVRSLGRKIYMSYGLAEGVGFRIERHGVFVHKGVGNGYIISNGVVIRGHKEKHTGKAIPHQTTTTMNRHPQDWFNPVMDRYVPELADKIAILNADAAINEMHVRIQ